MAGRKADRSTHTTQSPSATALLAKVTANRTGDTDCVEVLRDPHTDHCEKTPVESWPDEASLELTRATGADDVVPSKPRSRVK